MKKVIFMLLGMITFALAADAQTSYRAKIKGKDTLTNAANDTAVLTVNGAKTSVGFQVNAIKLTGTIGATSAIDYYGSIDGTNYGLIATDSMNTNASKNFVRAWNYNAYTKYRVIVKAAGTQTSSYEVWALYR